jgi:Tfp pilus assembly protein PilF
MTSAPIANLLRLLESGRDNALLRFSLGNEYLKADDPARAAEHLARAVEHDPEYSAAWKLLGRALEARGDAADALAAYRQGIAVAERKGDKQAAKEMSVFARRIERNTSIRTAPRR